VIYGDSYYLRLKDMKTKSHRSKVAPFESTHRLDFEVAEYPNLFPSGDDRDNWRLFRIGTCHGLWRATDWAYEILSIQNEKPGNGHFEDVLEWFANSCRRDGKALRIREVGNPLFKTHLITKRGFKTVGSTDVMRRYK